METYWDLFREAIDYGRKRKYKEAITRLRYIVSITDEIEEAFLYLGRSYHAQGDFPQAIDVLRRFIELRPQSAAGYFFLGRSLLSAGNYSHATRALEKSIEIRPDLLHAKSLLGYVYLKLRHSERAVELLEEAVTADPKNEGLYTGYLNALLVDGIKKFRKEKYDYAEELFSFLVERKWGGILPHLYLGMIHRIEEEFELALDDYRRALDFSPKDELIHYRIGILLAKTGRSEEAKEIFGGLRKNNTPSSTEADRYLAEGYFKREEFSQALYYALEVLHKQNEDIGMHLLAGECYRELGKYEYADNHFHRVLDVDRRHSGAHYGLSLIRWQRNDFEGMLTYLKKIERFEPGSDLVHYYSVLCNWKLQRDADELLPVVQEAVHKFGPDPFLLTALADSYEREEYFDLAKKWYRKVLSIRESHVDAYRGLISLFYKSEEVEDIEEVFDRYFQLVPEDRKRRRLYIKYLYDKNDYKRTIEKIEDYFAAGGQDVDEEEEDLYFERIRAICYRKKEDFETAAELYRRLLQKIPSKEEFLRPYVYCLEKSGKEERAADVAEKSLEYLKSPSVTIPLIAGVLRYKLGDIESALIHFRKASEIEPTDWRAHYNIGELYRRKGMEEFARRFLSRAEDLKKKEKNSLFS